MMNDDNVRVRRTYRSVDGCMFIDVWKGGYPARLKEDKTCPGRTSIDDRWISNFGYPDPDRGVSEFGQVSDSLHTSILTSVYWLTCLSMTGDGPSSSVAGSASISATIEPRSNPRDRPYGQACARCREKKRRCQPGSQPKTCSLCENDGMHCEVI